MTYARIAAVNDDPVWRQTALAVGESLERAGKLPPAQRRLLELLRKAAEQ